MPSLPSELRRQLENVIVNARDVAEAAARSALIKRAVDAAESFPHFSDQDKQMRNRLRARGRQAGDLRKADKTQSIDFLTQELAYEFWHRMLFARFLAENHLLMHPDGVAVSLEECEELAPTAEPPAANGFVLAARYASKMLPQIFRTDDVLLEVEFAPEHRLALEKLLASLPIKTFVADDSLGWVYQFWQSKKKEEVNASGEKITGKTISAVTQLFTEHYMVQFLLHNTIGAWWAGKEIANSGPLKVVSEQTARDSVALPEYKFDYLRFIQNDGEEAGTFRPAAGTFEGWPKTAAELKVLDPCCGSGHFLVAGFELLVPLRMAEEELDLPSAVDAVLRDNLHGLELDPRCTQIAAFNLALAAWKLAGYRSLPTLHIACSGIGPTGKLEEWIDLAKEAMWAIPRIGQEPVRNGLANLHHLFSQAPTLGSLIDPKDSPHTIFSADYETLEPVLAAVLMGEKTDDDSHERAVAAQGMAKAAELLAAEYTLVVTNVPYLGRGKQDPILQAWAEEHEPDAKADLATIFISRSFKWLARGGTFAVVSPQNWLFLTTYKKLRQRLLREETWNLVARLGPNAFQDMNWWAATTTLLAWTHGEASVNHRIFGVDVSEDKRQTVKASLLRGDTGSSQAELRRLAQAGQRNNPDSTIILSSEIVEQRLGSAAGCFQGTATGDDPRARRNWWEFSIVDQPWQLIQTSCEGNAEFDGLWHCFLWGINGDAINWEGKAVRGASAWGCDGVGIANMNRLSASRYLGVPYDQNLQVLIPKRQEYLAAIWCFCASDKFLPAIREVDQKVNVTTSTVPKASFDLAFWQAVAAEKYPNGLPEPESDDPTQWLFHGQPKLSERPLQVAVVRLLGYRWPAELDTSMRLSQRAKDLVARCDELLPLIDDDGIVCVGSIRGEAPAYERMVEMVSMAYGGELPGATMQNLLTKEGMDPGSGLDDWLRNSFFEQHCKLFHHRPFIWHIWDGRKDGFSALVNYHRLDHKTLENLTYAYLGDWIKEQTTSNKPGADSRLGAAQALQEKLKLILAGEPPYDIFVRWEPLDQQAIGWHPDLNHGVRMNIRPFVEADILRKKPNVKWTKDRGREPKREKKDFPWFWDGDDFVGDRVNDVHLTHAQKLAARKELATQ